MSVERLVMRALTGTVAAKVAGNLLIGVSGVAHAVASAIDDVGQACGYIESHYGREYHKLTGQDLAELLGEPGLYEGEPQTEELEAGEGEEEEA